MYKGSKNPKIEYFNSKIQISCLEIKIQFVLVLFTMYVIATFYQAHYMICFDRVPYINSCPSSQPFLSVSCSKKIPNSKNFLNFRAIMVKVLG